METGAEKIAAERQRQIEDEEWSLEHDDHHPDGQILHAAICYAEESLPYDPEPRHFWPWERCWWKPSEDKVRNLVKAGALIAAEIDRLEREKQGGAS